MIECKNCKAQISPKATCCPQCNTPTSDKAYGHCRVCGTQLLRHLYKEVVVSSYQVEGTTRQSATVAHTPCPKCGDPKPLYNIGDNMFVQKIIMLAIFGGLSAVILTIIKLSR